MGRWQTRESFFHSVCESAIELRHTFIKSSTFLECFLDSGASRIREELRKHPAIDQLRQSLKTLIKRLKGFAGTHSHHLIVAFDEAHSLFTAEIEGDEMSGGRYYAFHRIISLLKDISAWFVFLSTESTIRMVLPPDYQLCTLPLSPINPSARMRLDSDTVAQRGPLQLWDPFIAFPLDLADAPSAEKDVEARQSRERSEYSGGYDSGRIANLGIR